jgi:hypothetical protein
MNLIEHAIQSIDKATCHVSDIDNRILALPGMSSPKVRHFLNNIVKLPECNYLEIGCWKGSTTVSALYKNHPKMYWVIDNFSQNFYEAGNVKADFLNNFITILGYQPNLIDRNYVSFDPYKEGIRDVNVYFYDGDHIGNAQELALKHYLPCLQKEFIYICDDWNGYETKKVTKQAIIDLKLQVLFEVELPNNGHNDMNLWWEGLYVSVMRKP